MDLEVLGLEWTEADVAVAEAFSDAAVRFANFGFGPPATDLT